MRKDEAVGNKKKMQVCLPYSDINLYRTDLTYSFGSLDGKKIVFSFQ
jgi:hypothetical protein